MSHRKIASDPLGMTSAITRRDFINGVAAGSGAALLSACRGGDGARDPLSPSGSPWTGFGGVGDYRWSNGNTQAVMEVAHRFRDGARSEEHTCELQSLMRRSNAVFCLKKKKETE